MGCVYWDPMTAGNLVCADAWRFTGWRLKYDDGSTHRTVDADGPGDGQPITTVGCVGGAARFTVMVGDLDRKDGWEGRGSYSC
jgi:hypothetical protein